jgi:AcrR family transcriptional regulator
MTTDSDLLFPASFSAGEIASPAHVRGEEGDTAKRRQIVEGARTIFLDRGFEGASMGEIARCAGVSKGTLYVYFQNKEQLFCAIMEEERRAHFASILAIDSGLPVDAALRTFGERLLSFLLDTKKIAAMRTAMGIAERMPEVGRDFYERGPGQTIRLVRNYLEHKAAEGELAIADLDLAATQFLDLIQSSLIRPALFGIEVPAAERPARVARVVESGVSVFLKAYRAG